MIQLDQIRADKEVGHDTTEKTQCQDFSAKKLEKCRDLDVQRIRRRKQQQKLDALLAEIQRTQQRNW